MEQDLKSFIKLNVGNPFLSQTEKGEKVTRTQLLLGSTRTTKSTCPG